MSKVKIEGNASGTGTLTISAPNTNTDRSLTLPDGAGEILTDASTLSSSNLSGAIGTSNMPSGTVLQVVSSTHTTDTSTSSTSFVTTGHSVTLTPSSTSSKVYVTLQGGGGWVAAGAWLLMTIYRGGTNIGGTNYFTGYSSSGDQNITHSMSVFDSPSTTSSTTYTVYFRTNNAANTPQYRWSDKGNPVLTAMEIAG